MQFYVINFLPSAKSPMKRIFSLYFAKTATLFYFTAGPPLSERTSPLMSSKLFQVAGAASFCHWLASQLLALASQPLSATKENC